MPSTLAKITIGATSIAGVSGGTVASTYLLLQDKTIKDRLKREGKVLIQKSRQYQIAFKELKSKPDFVQTINNKDVTDGSDHNIGGVALSAWCKEKLPLPLTNENQKNLLPKVSEYCTMPPLTIREKIDRNNKKLINNWEVKFDSIKSSEVDLQADLTAIDESVTNINQTDQKNKAVVALKQWCEKKMELDLLNAEIDTIWGKIEKRCIENKSK